MKEWDGIAAWVMYIERNACENFSFGMYCYPFPTSSFFLHADIRFCCTRIELQKYKACAKSCALALQNWSDRTSLFFLLEPLLALCCQLLLHALDQTNMGVGALAHARVVPMYMHAYIRFCRSSCDR